MRPILLTFLILCSYLSKAQVSTFTNYAELRGLLDNTRVVMLGEVNHSDQTSMIEKVELIKYLYDSLGFDVLAFESSIYDMAKASENSEKDMEEALYLGIFPIWHNTQSIDSLIQVLKTRKFTLAGFDNQICSGGEGICLELVDDLEKFLTEHAIECDKRTLTSLRVEVKSFHSDKYSISGEFDPSILEKITSLANSIKSTNYAQSAFWYQNLISIHGLLFDHYHNGISKKNSSTFKPIDSNVRDSLMASNVMYLLDQFPGSKIICWGATYHFSNDVRELYLPNNDFSTVKPMGYYLKKEVGERITILGFTDLGKAASKNELLENADLYKNERALYSFSEGSIGKSSFLKYAPYPAGNWSEVLDFGIVINSKGPARLSGRIVSSPGVNGGSAPIPYALIQIEGTTQGSVANENGEFELIIPPELLNRKIIFSSMGYVSLLLRPSEVGHEVVLFEKAALLDEVVITPKGDDPIQVVRELARNRIERVPKNPLTVTMYNYQEELDSKSSEPRIRESALEYYYENMLQKNELKILNILNCRSSKKKSPITPWPFAPSHADFSVGLAFTIDQTFKKLQIDSLYSYGKDKGFYVIEYSHPKPSAKIVGFSSVTSWTGRIIYNPETMTIQSHQNEVRFKDGYGLLYHISFNVAYFEYQDYIFPRLMTANYQYKNEDGSTRNGTEKILITQIELDNPQKPLDRIWEFKNAPYNKTFWKSFNTIPLSQE